ncbi:glutamyl-Q tRNA(Asp) synthetase [Methylohalomonas lacus]|uniref:Glutamyl-Q tRNA(Asp) synthetase n=1 Tax=Methylohalomonas lacus TaxID=398773 RepID=A0AAE3HI01_9GAMM|nr:tRNA glutamyl-Q(34) synthetase GluQRS [Methylohalomonas lacus]MCS3902700.1 glutamyl-Q tRNA(Asp) synthetase [Methylohalomonas lacus]
MFAVGISLLHIPWPAVKPASPYHGRFAPTPSGALHFGSVIAALGSYLQARASNGLWSVRIDDLDKRREAAGAADVIRRDLEHLGLQPDQAIVYQSERLADYQAALARLQTAGYIFACGCTRREAVGIYPGTCRNGLPPGRKARSLRLRVPARRIHFRDALQGVQDIDLTTQVGDFVVHRADGVIAYHLATVVDDAAADISEVVRGADLLAATAPQILLQELLELPTPAYLHLPVAQDQQGRKISKQNHARPIADQPAAQVLVAALAFLGQQPPAQLEQAATTTVLDWAVEHWQPARIPAYNPQRCR